MGLITEGLDVLKLVNKAQNFELYEQIAKWIDKVAELQKQNEELTAERNRLRDEIVFKGVLERIEGHTFVQGDDEEICPRCAEVESILVHLQAMSSKTMPGVKSTCPNCKTAYLDNKPRNRAHFVQRNSSQ